MFLKWARRDQQGLQYLNVSLAESSREAGQNAPRQRIIAHLGGGYTKDLTNPDPWFDRERARFWRGIQTRLERVSGMDDGDCLRICHEIGQVVPLPAGWKFADGD